MMNIKSVKYLMLQDLIAGKRRIVTAFLMNLVCSGIVLLILLSFKVGNLGKYLVDDLPVDMIKLYSTIMLIISPLSGLDYFFGTAIFEISPKWKKYRLSTPVTPFTFAASKYLLVLLFVVVIVICSGINLLLAGVVGNINILPSVIKISTMLGCGLLIISILLQLAYMWFGNPDKAGIALICVLVPIVCLIYGKFSGGAFENISMDDMPQTGLAEDMLNKTLSVIDNMNVYFAPVMIITLSVFVLGFLGTVYIYGKKEK